MAQRDKLYDIFNEAKVSKIGSIEWSNFKEQRKVVQTMSRAKMTDFFKEKCSKSFKAPKKYWSFYKSIVKTKKSSSKENINCIKLNDETFHDSDKIAEAFNDHFANLASKAEISEQQSRFEINDNFMQFKRNDQIKVNVFFHFIETNSTEVNELIKQLDCSSSPGITGIPTKVIKHCSCKISPILAKLFNNCISTNTIPIEFKTAIVNPLFKGKGDPLSMDDYRGICCLPPIAKVFERILNKQVVKYFETNNHFCDNQHGFRVNHSCETALISIVDYWKDLLGKNEIILALFLDFKKAYDLNLGKT